ncbi:MULTISPECIES: MFS transporter [Paraburkholderia]|uniref:MFS transporter n=1 Tax=Paraburkholderia TaxID=1822464 RepID=UPI001B0661A5|nr:MULTISPECIES: MFS transporter [Paraburkholderia]MCX4152504.1 MFS transporter [Paraburkholderia aspalathi]MDN7161919.1 MFS transporter [Paraburkholderia sp. SECH2]MDQ6390405.1 MFS transporter [Paraburkholderia aspalathi]CAE6714626.1 Putative niacin/nicotinamide transporter NaiP [Paraburkholderia aspalathi]
MSAIAARLERLPLSGFHRKLLLIGGLGYMFDGLDSSSLAFLLPVVSKLWHLTSAETGLVASSTYIGYFFGAFLSGVLADVIGRRRIMMSALAIYCCASLASATATDWHTFFALRIVAGFGSGAETVVIAPFLAEFVPRRYRGIFCGALVGFMSFGYLGSSILGFTVVRNFAEGWRYLAVATSLPVVMLLWWRRTLPESPRWLESQGRASEAEGIVSAIESWFAGKGISLAPVASLGAMSASASAPAKGNALQNVLTLWSPRLARTTAVSWLMWFSVAFAYYSFFSWIPSLLLKEGLTMTKSFGYSIAIYGAQIPGYFTAAWLNERLGRKGVVASYMLLGGIAAITLAFSHTGLQIMAAGICLSFFMNGAFAGVYAYTPEVFPTAVRATGTGSSSSFGRIGSVSAPILVGLVYPVLGFLGVFAMTTTVLLVGACVVFFLGVETRNRSLEDIEEGGAGQPQDLRVPLSSTEMRG